VDRVPLFDSIEPRPVYCVAEIEPRPLKPAEIGPKGTIEQDGITDAGAHRCRLSLFKFNAVPGLILKDFHAREPLEFCFIEYSFSVIKSPREPHFPNRSQRYVLDSTRLPF
jgi:hypothetical protein